MSRGQTKVTRAGKKLSADQLHRLLNTGNWPGLRHGSLHIALICFTGSVILWATAGNLSLLWLVPILIGHGILLVFLFAPLHESVHGTVVASKPINRLIGILCGAVIFLPPIYFGYFHRAHHRTTQIVGEDPELESDKTATLGRYLVYMSGLGYWVAQIKMLFTVALGRCNDPFIPESARFAVVWEARQFVLGYLAVFGASLFWSTTVLLWVWLIPIVLGQPFLRAFLLAEHALCPTVSDMFQNTRTTKTNGLVRFLCWNMCYHTEHHAYPGVPFFRLPEANQLLEPFLINVGTGYVEVNRQVFKSVIETSNPPD